MDSEKHVEINFGKVCNNKCLFCMTKRDDLFPFVSLPDVKREIDEFSRKGFNSLGFLGGEPTIYPWIKEAVSHARDAGFKEIHIVSNGRRYCDMRFLHMLIDAGATRFSVSIHSHIPEVEDRLTQARGGCRQKLAGLKNLAVCKNEGLIKCRISINIVINRLNYRTLPDSISFFRGMGFSEFRLNSMRPEGRAFSNFDQLGVRYSDCMPVINTILKSAKREGFGATLEGFPFCVLGDAESPERFTGELRDHLNLVVCFNDSGKKSKDTFLWKKRRKEELKVKGPDCRKCRYDPICEGIWKGYVEKVGFDEFKSIRGR